MQNPGLRGAADERWQASNQCRDRRSEAKPGHCETLHLTNGKEDSYLYSDQQLGLGADTPALGPVSVQRQVRALIGQQVLDAQSLDHRV